MYLFLSLFALPKSLTTGRIQVTKANKLVSNYLVRENERVPGIIAAYLTH